MLIPADQVRIMLNDAKKRRRAVLFGVDYELRQGFFVPDPLSQHEVLFRMGSVRNYEPSAIGSGPTMAVVRSTSLPEYARKFEVIERGLRDGDTFLANLTDRTEVAIDRSLEAIFKATDSPFGIYHPQARFVSFSPESFVTIDALGRIASFPMKGTIDASLPDAHDRILADHKELCEHRTIVDLIRNDLSMVANEVRVDRFRYVEQINSGRNSLLQVSSEISGLLPEDYLLGDTLFRLLPAGSICGAPKLRTVELIQEAEGELDRGFYTGIFGYFDGDELQSAVAIRFIEQQADGRMFHRSGGGVTINSRMQDEYNEMLAKVYLPLRKTN